jgi:surface antigen
MIHQKRLLASSRLQKALKRKSNRKRIVRYGLIAANVVILAGVVGFVSMSSHSHHSVATALPAATTKPVDGLTSYDIAANVAKLTSLPESTAINNQAQSAKVALAVSASDSNVIAKPQIVATALKSRKDIHPYTVAAGDTVTTIAQKFGVTSDSIRWSNNLTGDTVSLGAKLTVPPVTGIVYTVKDGDTIQSLATKYKANVDQIVAFNDAEISGIKLNEQILIPNGQIEAAPVVAPVRFTTAAAAAAVAVAPRSSSFTAQYGSNGYDYGYCTYYVAARSGAPSNWGNANTWAYYASQSSWTVSSVPQVGAIAQTSRGYLGHVAIVEEVSADGTQMKYSDMNGIAGWGRVGYSGWVSASYFEHYIYH